MTNELGLVMIYSIILIYIHLTYYNQFHYQRQIIVCEAHFAYCGVFTVCFVSGYQKSYTPCMVRPARLYFILYGWRRA